MRKVLIISPHFPPVNAPDMQRVRMALPHLRALGWEPVVLAVHPDSVEGAVIEPLLEKTYPADIRVIRVQGLPARLTRKVGLGSLWWRCARMLRKAGDSLLASERFDLVFFSTTQFDAFTLGPRWRRRFGVPFVLDYQDPWVNDYYRRTGTRPPGGALKFWVSQFTARRREPEVLRSAAGVISVSTSYGPDLHARYPWISAEEVCTLPFGTSARDFETARRHPLATPLIPFGDGHIHHVYAGRCGPDMIAALTVLFLAFKKFLGSHPDEAARHRFHFIGTDYSPPPLGCDQVIPTAEKLGVGAYVTEHRHRVPYFDALYYLSHADALVVIGSDDPTYSASKIFPYLLAHRPLMLIVHRDSQMLELARSHGIVSAHGITRDPSGNEVEIIDLIHAEWFAGGGHQRAVLGCTTALAPYSAENMTARLVSVFDRALRP